MKMGPMRRFLLLLAICVTAYVAYSVYVLAYRRITRQPLVALSSCYQFIFDRSMASGKPFPVLLSDMPEWKKHVENTADPKTKAQFQKIEYYFPLEGRTEGQEIAHIILPRGRAVLLYGGAVNLEKK